MQRMVAAVLNDPLELGNLIAAHRPMFDLAGGIRRGGWGVGYHHHGEILVRRHPIDRRTDTASAIAASPRPHLVAWAGPPERTPFRLDQVQPLRYRNWLWASTGGQDLGTSFVERIQAYVRGFTAHGRTLAGVPEAVMLVFMKALHAAGELDHRGLATHGIRRGIQAGAAALRDLLGEAWRAVSMAALLHVRGLTFGLSLGRPLYRLAFEGLEPARPDRVVRQGPAAHLRAMVLTDAQHRGEPAMLDPWTAVELTDGRSIETFALA